MQAEGIRSGDIEGFETDSLVPDASSIVELGKRLLLGAKNGDTDAVRDLMCRGAPFTTDWLGTSALHLAAQNNHAETAEVLLRAGISRDARTKVDRTPLHMAAYEGHHEMAQLLLNYGADVDSRDMLKMTPLHWAVEREHVDVMHVLLEHGADANATSKFDKTPMSLALEHDRLDLVDVLQQERDILGLHAQHQNQASTAELEEATHSLMQLEAERQQQQQFEIQQQQQQQQQQQHHHQQQQQKRKLAQANAGKKQRMVFQQIRVALPSDDDDYEENDDDVDRRGDDEEDDDDGGNAALIDDLTNAENGAAASKRHRDSTTSLEQPLRLLQAHGITMIPVDNDASIVENAIESGGTVVLTEAGKLALNLTRTSTMTATTTTTTTGTPTMGIKRLHAVGSRRGTSRKVITIRADQILGNQNTVAAAAATTTLSSQRAPNILKRNTSDKQAGKLYFTPVQTKTTPVTAKNKITGVSSNVPKPVVLRLDDDIEEITEDSNAEQQPVVDIALLNRQLFEARRQAAEYRKQLLKKEEEAEIYKQQLKNMTAAVAAATASK